MTKDPFFFSKNDANHNNFLISFLFSWRKKKQNFSLNKRNQCLQTHFAWRRIKNPHLIRINLQFNDINWLFGERTAILLLEVFRKTYSVSTNNAKSACEHRLWYCGLKRFVSKFSFIFRFRILFPILFNNNFVKLLGLIGNQQQTDCYHRKTKT